MSQRCEIIWDHLSLEAWDELFARIPRSNILQSYPYAQAYCQSHQQRAHWGLIRIDGQDAGLVQIFEVGLLRNMIHAVSLDRGPLWLPEFGTAENILSFYAEFDRLYPRRFGRRRRIIPEVRAEDALLLPMKPEAGIDPYKTIWIDLSGTEEELRAHLDKKWRNALSKAERSPISFVWDQGQHSLDWILQHHSAHREIAGYKAASPRFIRLLARYFGARQDMFIARAFLGEEAIAGVLFFRHGSSATYQIGWNGPEGRQYNAHHLLLWQAMLKLKASGVSSIDLGGINNEADGVRAFKEGLGGEAVTLSGIYH
ncbi:MAG: lipid II:glycine glycyltransferase FemX [Micavibrio sp.]